MGERPHRPLPAVKTSIPKFSTQAKTCQLWNHLLVAILVRLQFFLHVAQLVEYTIISVKDFERGDTPLNQFKLDLIKLEPIQTSPNKTWTNSNLT